MHPVSVRCSPIKEWPCCELQGHCERPAVFALRGRHFRAPKGKCLRASASCDLLCCSRIYLYCCCVNTLANHYLSRHEDSCHDDMLQHGHCMAPYNALSVPETNAPRHISCANIFTLRWTCQACQLMSGRPSSSTCTTHSSCMHWQCMAPP